MTAMTDDTLNLNPNSDLQEDPLTTLKSRADLMGIKYHPSIGLEALQAKIDAQLTESAPAVEETSNVIELPVESENARNLRLKREATELIRVNVVCMNPNKTEYQGEIFTTGNAIVGTIRKFVMFGVDYHVERMILNMLEERQCQVFYTHIDTQTGKKERRAKLIKEFNINYLPPLSEADLHDLAQRQAMAGGLGD